MGHRGHDRADGPDGQPITNGTTNLQSAIDPGTLGNRFGNGGSESGGTGGVQAPTNFVLPITVVGTTAPGSTQVADVNSFRLTAGETIDGSTTDDVALVGKDLAKKNNLSVGSTFTAYGQTITVKGIYDTGNTFSNGGVIMPLGALQKLSSQDGDVTSAIVTVDSVDHLDATVTALQKTLGNAADVVSDQSASADTLSSLDNVKTIATYSLMGALVAGAVDHLPEHGDDRPGAAPGDRCAQGDRLVERQDLVAVRHRGVDAHRHGRGRRGRRGCDPQQPGARRPGVGQLELDRPHHLPGSRRRPDRRAALAVPSASVAGSAGGSPSSATCSRTCTPPSASTSCSTGCSPPS